MWEQKSNKLSPHSLDRAHPQAAQRRVQFHHFREKRAHEGGVIVPRPYSQSGAEQIQGKSLTPMLKCTCGVLVYGRDIDREVSASLTADISQEKGPWAITQGRGKGRRKQRGQSFYWGPHGKSTGPGAGGRRSS